MVSSVSEFDVLIATALWLHENGWTMDSVSLAKGQGLPPIEEQKASVKQVFADARVPYDEGTLFKNRGPDIVARSGTTVWKFECKGIGQGTAQTHRNNFDRAVASVVSYYDTPQTRLGLALANDYLWEHTFGGRLPMHLREAIGLWVFLIENGKAYPYEPTHELPYPRALV